MGLRLQLKFWLWPDSLMTILDPAAVLRISLLCSQKQCPVIFWPNPMIFQTWRAWQEDHTFSSCPKTQLTFNDNVNTIATSCKKIVFENHLPRKLDKPLLPDSQAFLKEFLFFKIIFIKEKHKQKQNIQNCVIKTLSFRRSQSQNWICSPEDA